MVKLCSNSCAGMKAAATFAAGGPPRGARIFGAGAPPAGAPDPIRAPIGPKSAPGIGDNRDDPTPAPRCDHASDSLDDANVAGATAQVAAKTQPDAPLVGLPQAQDQVTSGDKHSRRAESALQGVFAIESRAQLDRDLVVVETLDGGDFGAAAGAGQGDAWADRLAIDEERARPANPMLASQVRSGEVQVLAQEVGEMPARLDLPRHRAAVDAEREPHRLPFRPHAASWTFAVPCPLA